MEQRALNLEQPKPKRKITRKSPKRRKILKYVKENPLADVNESPLPAAVVSTCTVWYLVANSSIKSVRTVEGKNGL